MRRLLFYILGALALVATPAFAGPDEAENVAMGYLADYLAEWIEDQEPKVESIAIFAINANAPLDAAASRMFESELRRELAARKITKVSLCVECANPYVTVKEDKVIVSQGVADTETLKKVAGKFPEQTFLIVDLYRTKLRMSAHAQLYNASSGETIGVEKWEVPALNLSDSSAQVIVAFGGGRALQTTSQDFVPAGFISLLEEVGFAKAGLTGGAVLGGSLGTMIYADPTIAFRGYLGNSGVSWSLMLGVGYGFVGTARGFHTRASLEILMGSWALFGLDGNYLIHSGSTKPTLPAYAGFHVGIAFGR